MIKINWTKVAVFAVVALLAFLIGTDLFGGWGRWFGGCCGWGGYDGRFGGWGMGPGMMGWGFAPFGWISMIFMALIPLGFLGLIVVGIVLLVRAVSGNTPARSASGKCPNCDKPVQADWQKCPYCGTALAK